MTRTIAVRIARPLVALIVIVVVAISTYAWSKVDAVREGTVNVELNLQGGKDGAIDILMVGSDSRTDAHGNPLTPREIRMLHAGDDIGATNTDTILLVRIPNNGKSATAISIPRDTWVNPPDMAPMKINGVYATAMQLEEQRLLNEGVAQDQAEKQARNAGRQALVHVISGLTGVNIDRYAEVGLLGFVLITDAVGGAEVCLNNAVYDPYSGARFRQGVQTLNGPKALAFVRQRHGLPRGDLDRITRQQVFMAAMVRKVLSAGVLTNPDKLNALSRAVQRSIVVDKDWDVVSFAQQMQHLVGEQVKFATIPVVNPDAHPINADGDMVSAVEVSPAEVRQWVKRMVVAQDRTAAASKRGKAPELGRVNIDRHSVTVTVLNAGELSGLAGAVAAYLTFSGYQLGTTSNADEETPTSYVAGNPTTMAAAKAVAKDLGDLPVQSDEEVPPGTVRVVLADDYDGPARKNGTSMYAHQLNLPKRETSATPTHKPISAGGHQAQCVN